MTENTYAALAEELTQILTLTTPPLAITFSKQAPEGIAAFTAEMPAATADGRTGRVPAGCVFWVKAQTETFTTVAEDHGNCSVGCVTHGFMSLEDAAGKSDVACLLEAGWVTPDMFPHIPTVKRGHNYATYGPLADVRWEPDVVFIRLNAKQAMVMSDAVPDIVFQGKPQCHIVAIAKEQRRIAISVGCMLSRVRTGLPNSEMTCAIPADQLTQLLGQLNRACTADKAVAAYASDDAHRFGNYLSV